MKLAEQLERILENRIAQDNLTLPLLPVVSGKISELARRSEATVKDLVDIIEQDPILAAVIMRLVAGAGMRTLEQAVTKLGVLKVRSLFAELSSHRLFDSHDDKTMEATRLL